MNNTETRSRGQVVRGRGVGTLVGARIGFFWMCYGLVRLPKTAGALLAVISVVICFGIIRYATGLIKISKTMPPPVAPESRANRKVRLLFWLNFIIEIILLNIVFQLLTNGSLEDYLIPAISIIVGIHFVPMAFFMKVRPYFFCAAALVVCAVITMVLLQLKVASVDFLAAIEAIANAIILWATAAQKMLYKQAY